MMPYTTILFDLDHTLVDAHTSEAAAFDFTLRRAGAIRPDDYFDTFVGINTQLWEKVERGELTPNHVRTARFEQLVTATDLTADPAAMGNDYVHGLGTNGDLYPDARNVLDQLSGSSALALITNGIGEVQRARLARLDIERYFDAVVISGEVGVAKPDAAIFDIVFDLLGQPPKNETLIVGDSLTSDMAGGINYGIATCWYAAHSDAPALASVDHSITSLSELPSITAK